MLDEKEMIRVVQEYRTEVYLLVEQLKGRLTVSNPKFAFSPVMVTAGLAYAALHYSLDNGLRPEQFVAAIRALADQLELEWTTKSGMFEGYKDA